MRQLFSYFLLANCLATLGCGHFVFCFSQLTREALDEIILHQSCLYCLERLYQVRSYSILQPIPDFYNYFVKDPEVTLFSGGFLISTNTFVSKGGQKYIVHIPMCHGIAFSLVVDSFALAISSILHCFGQKDDDILYSFCDLFQTTNDRRPL